MTWLLDFFKTSIGRKQLLALSGLAMGGFLITHLSGNLLLFADRDGTLFNDYAAFLTSQWWLIPAEFGLIAVYLLHLALASVLTLENRLARPDHYRVKDSSDASLASRTMILSGLLTFIFIGIHLLDFKFGDYSGENGLAGLVKRKLASPFYGTFYIAFLIVLAIHLGHGIQSTFQSFGLNHRSYTPAIKKICLVLAIGLCAGFASIPVWLMLTKGGA